MRLTARTICATTKGMSFHAAGDRSVYPGMKALVLLAFVTIGCLFTESLHAAAPSDSEVKTKVLGFWRSPRHEYEFKSNGKVYMLPMSPDTTKGEWSVKGGKFIWDEESYGIVTLTDKRFVYKSLSSKEGNESLILNRITAKMVGQSYNRESVK
jgi:hypothetical protein